MTALRCCSLVLCVAALASTGPAYAQGERPAAAAAAAADGAPLPRADREHEGWPARLRGRNARYAVLDRVVDREGDAHEELCARAHLARALDPAGDREEVRRALAVSSGHLGTVYAQVARELDRAGDRVVLALSATTRARSHASLARIRFPRASAEERVRFGVRFDDEVELVQYKEQFLEFGSGSEQVGIANEQDDPAAREYIEQRDELRGDTEVDNEEDREATLREEREEAGAADRADERADERADDDLDAEVDQELERLEEDEERDVERDLEGETERTLQSEEAAGLEGGL